MSKAKIVMLFLVVVLVVAVAPAHAVQDSGSGTFLDVLTSKAFKFITLGLIPLIALAAIILFAWNYNSGYVTLGEGTTKMLITIGVVGTGVAIIAGFLGVQMTTALLL